jgi:PAS domain S-box-containing protein
MRRAALTGYSAEELLKMKFIEIIDPDSIESAEAHFTKVIAEGRATGEVAFRTKTGEQRWWNVVGAKLSDDHCLRNHRGYHCPKAVGGEPNGATRKI